MCDLLEDCYLSQLVSENALGGLSDKARVQAYEDIMRQYLESKKVKTMKRLNFPERIELFHKQIQIFDRK